MSLIFFSWLTFVVLVISPGIIAFLISGRKKSRSRQEHFAADVAADILPACFRSIYDLNNSDHGTVFCLERNTAFFLSGGSQILLFPYHSDLLCHVDESALFGRIQHVALQRWLCCVSCLRQRMDTWAAVFPVHSQKAQAQACPLSSRMA